jgi:hypothetical protein
VQIYIKQPFVTTEKLVNSIQWFNSCGKLFMNENDLKAMIEQIKAEIKAGEEEYANALIAKKDYNTLKAIRNKIADLKNKLKEMNLIRSR